MASKKSKEAQYAIERNYTATGQLLQEFRVKNDLTQKEVADHLGYSSAQFISNFERGISAPPLSKLGKLLKFIDCAFDKYMGTYSKEEIAAQRAMAQAAYKSAR